MTSDPPSVRQLIQCFAALFMAACGGVGATQVIADAASLADLPLEELMRVQIVSASRRPQQLSDVPNAIHVITHEDISRSGVRTLPEVLRMAPGVDVAQLSPSGWAVGVRGETGRFANKLQVMIDGRSIFSPLYSGVLWEAERVPLEDIERIEVIRGAAGAVWGTNAVNGVINIITKEASQRAGIMVVSSVGTDGHDRLLLKQDMNLAQGSRLKLFGQADRQPGALKAEGGRDNNQAHVETAGFRWDQGLADGSKWSVQGQVLQSDKHGDLPLPSLSTLTYTITPTIQRIHKSTLTATLDKPLSAESDVHVQSSLLNQHLIQSGYIDQKNTSFDLDAYQHWHPQGSRHDVIWGMGLTRYEDQIQSIPLLTFEPNRRTLVNSRIFAQHEYALLPQQLLLTYGARLDQDEYSGLQTSPNARVLWKINEQSSGWMALSRAVRAPARQEADGGVNFNITGNPANFRAVINPDARIVEKMTGLDVGWRSQVRQNLSVDVNAYVQRYTPLLGIPTDLISNPTILSDVTVDGQRTITFAASAGTKTTTRGLELSTDWHISRWWRQQVAYSYMETQFSSPLMLTTLGGTPHSLLSLRESFDLNNQWTLDLWWRYTSERQDPLLPAYTLSAGNALDINVRWLATPDLTVSVGAHNLGRRLRKEINPNTSSQVQRAAFAKVEAAF